MSRATLYCGDVREVLAGLPDGSVQTCVTSPPYFGLRNYGMAGQLGLERTPDEYVAAMVGVFRAVRRVLRDDATLWLNLGDSYSGGGGYSPESPSNVKRREKGNHQDGPFGFRVSGQDRQPVGKPKGTETGLKSKDLVGIPWLVAFALRADGWYLRSDVIWCLSGGTRVYAKTQKGEMPMTIKDMVRLRPETVQLWNGGRWTQVLGWNESPRPESPVELVLRSGERITCTPNHQWPTARGVITAEEIIVGDVLDATTLPAPLCPREPSALDARLVGLFVGLYLAEGSRSGDTIQIAGHVNEEARLDLLTRVARAFGGTCARHAMSEHGVTINLNGKILNAILDTYLGGRTASDKHLAVTCWQRANPFLRAILEGYLAGDGHYDHANDRWRIGFTRNYSLEADLRTLCARLGIQCRIKPVVVTMDGRRFPAFRGEIRFDPSDYHTARSDGEVMEIRQGRARKFWDIGVADEPHTFALASGILTHNSKPNPMPESVTDRPTKAHEYLFLLSKSATYYYDASAIAEASTGQDGAAADFRRETKDHVIPGQGFMQHRLDRKPTTDIGTRNARSVWTIATQPYAGSHFAVMPEELVRRCILAGSSARACETCGAPWERVTETERHWQREKRVGERKRYAGREQDGRDHGRATVSTETIGWQPTCACAANTGAAQSIVLDPFGGSGTTAAVAVGHGRQAIYVDLNPAYLELARERIGPLLCDQPERVA